MWGSEYVYTAGVYLGNTYLKTFPSGLRISHTHFELIDGFKFNI